MSFIPDQAINFVVPSCSTTDATKAVCKVLSSSLDKLNEEKDKLSLLSYTSVVGGLQSLVENELGSNMTEAIVGIVEGYTSEFVSQVGSKIIDDTQKTALTMLTLASILLNGKPELLLAICQVLVSDLTEALTDYKNLSNTTLSRISTIRTLLSGLNDFGNYYAIVKEKLQSALEFLFRAQERMKKLKIDLDNARKTASDKDRALAQSYLYIAKTCVCPEHQDEYEEIGRKAFNIANEYGFSNFDTMLNKIWADSGSAIVKNVLGNIYKLSQQFDLLYNDLLELSKLAGRINFLKSSIISLQLGKVLMGDVYSKKLGLNKVILKYLQSLIDNISRIRKEISGVISQDKIKSSQLLRYQMKWCVSLKTILTSLESCITKQFMDYTATSGTLYSGYKDYVYITYPHSPSDDIISLTEAEDFCLTSALASAIDMKIAVFSLATMGVAGVTQMRSSLDSIENTIINYRQIGDSLLQDISAFNGYGHDVLLQLTALLRNAGLDRAADLLLTGNLSEFANLSYLNATYIGSSINCLKKIYGGLTTVEEKVHVDSMLRELYVQNRTKVISGLNIELVSKEYAKQLEANINDVMTKKGLFCAT